MHQLAERQSGRWEDLMPDTARQLFADLLRIGAGPLIWATHLGLVYGVTAIACARGMGGVATPVIVAATFVAVIAVTWLLVKEIRRGRSTPSKRQVAFFAAALAGLSAVAILWAGLPVAFVPACT
jgi:drug/metabolite transporter (DMT)-like permease